MTMLISVLKILWRGFLNSCETEIIGGGYIRKHSNNIKFINAIEKEKRNFLINLKFNYLVSCIYFLPKEVLERFKKEKILIRFTTLEEIRNKDPENETIGFFTYDGDNKFIFIGVELSFWEIRNTLYHEIGHLIDRCKIEDVSLSKQVRGLFTERDIYFEKVFKEERNVIQSEYHKKDVLEYFAQAFAYIACNNKYFTKNAKKTTSMVFDYVASL